jgi:hypothetical protein
MPRSQKKQILDMLEIIRNDENLRHEFAELILTTIDHEPSLANNLTNITSRELMKSLHRSGYT